jgi:hypothetical protein
VTTISRAVDTDRPDASARRSQPAMAVTCGYSPWPSRAATRTPSSSASAAAMSFPAATALGRERAPAHAGARPGLPEVLRGARLVDMVVVGYHNSAACKISGRRWSQPQWQRPGWCRFAGHHSVSLLAVGFRVVRRCSSVLPPFLLGLGCRALHPRP